MEEGEIVYYDTACFDREYFRKMSLVPVIDDGSGNTNRVATSAESISNMSDDLWTDKTEAFKLMT